jgi:hypothetical protein
MPSERIQLIIDVVTGSSKTALAKLKTDLAAADTAVGKLKVTGGAVGDFLKKNLAVGAAAAGTAIVSFASKAIGKFQDVALQAGEMSDSLGLSAEEASRLAEVATDIGVPVDAVASAIGRMNRAAADTPGAFDDIGAAIARNADGTVNVNETFLNTIDALNGIPDPAERASRAQKIFGRGWQQIAELVGMGADEVREALASVADSKVIDDGEVAKARDFRARMDELTDSLEGFALVAGEILVPAVGEAFRKLGQIIDPLGDVLDDAAESGEKFDDSIDREKIQKAWQEGRLLEATYVGVGSEAAKAAEDTEELAAAEEEQAAAAAEAAEAVKAQQDATERAAEAAERAADAHRAEADSLLAVVDAYRAKADSAYGLTLAQRDTARSQEDLNTAVTEANNVLADSESTDEDKVDALRKVQDAETSLIDAVKTEAAATVEAAKDRKAAKGATLSAVAAVDIMNRSLLDQASNTSGPVRDALVDHIATLNGIPPEKASEILALIDEGKRRQVMRKLNEASAPRTAAITAEAETAAAEDELANLARDRFVHYYAVTHPGNVNPGSAAAAGMVGTTGSLNAGGGNYVQEQLRRAAALNRQADAQQALAKSLGDTEEGNDAAAKAADLFRQAQEHVERAASAANNAIGEQADSLRELADALREQAAAAADAAAADQQRSESLTEAIDVQLAYEDTVAATAEALGFAGRAFTTEGVSAAQRAAAVNDAQQAALAQANAAVQRAREQAEAAGREFTGADAARVMQRELQRLAAVGGPVGRALQDLVKRLNFPQQIALAERAQRQLAREEALLARAEKREERAGELDEARSRAFERALVTMGRVFGQLARDQITPARAEKMIREALNEAARRARGGTR